ncbi:MAG: FAD-dependent oxidoreductase, partial [Alphaproteobacteria bacterium]
EEIPARKIELEGAVKEGIEFIYNTRQVAVEGQGEEEGLTLRCIKTEPGAPDADGRRRPVDVAGSEHDISCGMVIAAVGQFTACDDLEGHGLMAGDRVATEFDGMRTADPQVFAAGDGAFGGSTIVMAMHHGQRVAYYIKAFLEGRETPMPYRTPHRTRRVTVAQDQKWEVLALHEPDFFGLGTKPVEFPEIESTYDAASARDEAARCYRCDAETGSADYSVHSREDIFAMARVDPGDRRQLQDILERRLAPRANPFPQDRPATLDDLVFLPANLSRLVIDPYREACKIGTGIGGMDLAQPFFVTGFDDAPDDVRRSVSQGLIEAEAGYLGVKPISDAARWLQLVVPGQIAPSAEADALIFSLGHSFQDPKAARLHGNQVLGLAVSAPAALEEAISHGLEHGFDMLLLDGSGRLGAPWAELAGAPDLTMLRDAIRILRRLDREEEIDLVYFGGIRSGTDAAKVIAFGCKAVVLGVPVALAAGGEIAEGQALRFAPDHSTEERAAAIANIVKASCGEASMMARCTGKTSLHNLEPEDMRALTLATAEATDILLVGKH